MPKRSSKPPADLNRLASWITANATVEDRQAVDDGKNPAAVMLGRMGGLKGGPARARKLSKRKRQQIAAKAAATRWGKR